MEKLKWAFELMDKMSGNSNKISKALLVVKKRLDDGSIATVKFQQNSEKASKTTGVFDRMLGNFNFTAAGVGAAIMGIVAALGVATFKFGETAFEALAMKESTLASFKLMLGGSKKAAKELFGESLSLAKQTPFGEETVVQSYKQLMATGFTKQEVPVVFQALGDVSAASGFKAETMADITTQLAQVKGKGKLQSDDLKQIIGHTSTAGVGLNKVYEQLAKMRGVAKETIPALLSGGQIKSDEGIFAIISAIKEASGGKVGNVMVEQSKTVMGQMTRLGATMHNAFLSMDLDNLPGFEAFKSFLDKINNLFKVGTPTAERFERVLTGLVNDLGEGIFGDISDDAMVGVFNKVMDVVEFTGKLVSSLVAGGRAFWEAFSPALEVIFPQLRDATAQGETMKNVFQALGYTLGTVAKWFLYIVMLPQIVAEKMKSFRTWLVDNMKELGVAMVSGLLSAFVPLTGNLIDNFKNVITGVKSLLGIHSPSKVFEDIGVNVVRGYEEGVDKEAPTARASTANMVAAPVARAMPGPGPNMSVQISIPMHVVATGGDDAEAVVRKLREVLPEELRALLNRVNAEAAT